MSRTIVIILLSASVGCAVQSEPSTLKGEEIFIVDGSNNSIATIDRAGQPSVWMTYSDSEVGLAIFQAKTGQPYVTLRDANGDGVFDLLTYASLSETGEWLGEVEDYGMDGQPDFILNVKDKTAAVFYDGSWHQVTGVGSGAKPTVSIRGEVVLLSDFLAKLGRGAF